MQTVCLCFTLTCLTTLFLSQIAHAQEETYRLKNGGEIRGVMMESDPERGTLVRLSDGTTRLIPPGEIAYSGHTGTGAVHVKSDAPGRASVDGGDVGRTPIDVRNLTPGPHEVSVEFADGASVEQTVFVQPGQLAEIYLRNTTHRDGVRFAIGFGPMLQFNAEWGLAPAGNLQLGANINLSPMFDVRLMGIISAGYALDPEDFWYELGILAAARMNLSTVYSMELGLRLGVSNTANDYDEFYSSESISTEFLPGLQVSLLSLRLGSQRNFELTLWHALLIGEKGNIQNGITCTWIFVGA